LFKDLSFSPELILYEKRIPKFLSCPLIVVSCPWLYVPDFWLLPIDLIYLPAIASSGEAGGST
jgi:hypothetical protein